MAQRSSRSAAPTPASESTSPTPPTLTLLTKSPAGKAFKKPIALTPAQAGTVDRLGKGLSSYILESLSAFMPSLIPFALDNESIVSMAKYLYRYKTQSRGTLGYYCYYLRRFTHWTGKGPDQMMSECRSLNGDIDQAAARRISNLMEEYLGILQDEGLSPKTVATIIGAIKTLFSLNGVKADLPYPLPQRVVCKDRAPTPEELSRLLDLADLRGKVVVSTLALGGFREGTLVRLKYRHVKDDLEKGIVPLHIHVEAEITKGKYCDYDTFLGREAVDYLRLYLEERRRGSPCGKIPPETITDESPLIRNERSRTPEPISENCVYKAVHDLYARAGLLKPKVGKRYDLRVHSIRKFFRTQLTALGVPTDYIEYMMGHRISTYNDVQMKGIEFLRNVYAASGLSIRPKTQLGRIDVLKEIIRAWGMNPEQILTKEALSQPHRVCAGPAGDEEDQVKALSSALKEMMRRELLNATDHSRPA